MVIALLVEMLTISMASLASGRKNQDRIARIHLPDADVLLVADGAGGVGGGARAAQMLVNALPTASSMLARNPEACVDWLSDMDDELFRDSEAGESTAVVLVISISTIFGASVGDSRAWLVHAGRYADLTVGQARKPLLGSGRATVTAIGPSSWRGMLLMGTDGLFNYVSAKRLAAFVENGPSDNVATRACELAKLPSGDLADDTSAIACTRPLLTQRPKAILLVENHPVFASTVTGQFLAAFEVHNVRSVAMALAALDSTRWDFVLVDYDLDDGKGVAVVEAGGCLTGSPQIVAISAHERGNQALMRAGAHSVCNKSSFHEIADHLKQVDEFDRLHGILIGGLLGDALGAPLEGTPVGDLRRLETQLVSRIEGTGPWGYTDDTEMAFGVAESLIECNGLKPEDLLCTLARNHDVGRGYGKGTRRAFEALLRGQHWEAVRYASWPSGSKGNGGAARIGALAWFYRNDERELLRQVDRSAAITHAHPQARLGAQLLAVATHVSLRQRGVLDAETTLFRLGELARGEPEFVERIRTIEDLLCHPDPSLEDVVSRLGHGVLATESVSMAIYCFLRWQASPREAIAKAILVGGDTDTIGAMTGALVGALHGALGMPTEWLAKLEKRSRSRALELAELLAASQPVQ